ncbi:hypothetical protein J3458_003484 [Metarhizium acridum]|uniref:uncharacterized protein n=1 Tax=Metarhizium acridum TaxID=92637 RepID=UPI001C6C2464|nr:hypothetical protein J3458_003484 [Metarhizium acridum]
MHRACGGDWDRLAEQQGLTLDEMEAFLEFAASFLSGSGSYFVRTCVKENQDKILRRSSHSGRRGPKVIPQVSADALRKMANSSPQRAGLLDKIIGPILSMPPSSLGFPYGNNQSNYFPEKEQITGEEVAAVAQVMEKNLTEPENTRVSFTVLQASSEMASKPKELSGPSFEAMVRLETGHHAAGMSKICFHLDEAAKYVSNARQADILAEYIECFSTGSLEAYRNPQKSWVADIFPRVETILGFVEPYGDPYGVRAEWEGVVCIPDPDETYKLKALVEKSTMFIRSIAIFGKPAAPRMSSSPIA